MEKTFLHTKSTIERIATLIENASSGKHDPVTLREALLEVAQAAAHDTTNSILHHMQDTGSSLSKILR